MLFRLPRWSLVVLFVVSVLFVLVGMAMAVTGAEGAWPGLFFFGLCAAIFAAQLWPNLLLSQKPEPVEMLLARYPGPVELHIPQRKTLLVLAGMVIFAGVALWYLHNEQPSSLAAALLWFCIAALVLGLPFVLYQLIRGASLRLEADGFRIKQPWKWRFVRWKDASEFGIGSTALIASHKGDWSTLVTFDDANADDSRVAALNRSIVGRNSSLPDSYGLLPEDLQTLMNRWRERALRDV
jgi:hypothetical protein